MKQIFSGIKSFRPHRNVWLLLVAVVMLQGCIEIGEEVTVNPDRSGRLSLSVSLSQGDVLMQLLGRYVDLSGMDEIGRKAEQAAFVLQSSPGISNVDYRFSRRSGNINLAFDFDNHRSLNRALYAVAGMNKTFLQPGIYKIRNHTFTKKNMTTWFRLLVKQAGGQYDEALLDLVEIRSVYHLPKPVTRVSDKNATVSQDGRRVSTSAYISDVINQKINTGIRIRY